jgi:hypothetical protein
MLELRQEGRWVSIGFEAERNSGSEDLQTGNFLRALWDSMNGSRRSRK